MWWNLAQAIVVAVVTAGIGYYLTGRRESAKSSRSRDYLALQVAFILEQFAIACASSIQDNENHRGSGGAIGQESYKLPDLFDYPAEGDYSQLDPESLGQILAFRLKVDTANSNIDFTGEINGERPAQDECIDQCARLGLQAIELSNALSKRYRLPKFDLEKNVWDFKRVLHKYHEKWGDKVAELHRYAPPTYLSDE